MGAATEVKGQNGPPKPETFIDPDHDIFFMIDLDSVVQFSYPDISDSTRLNKWEYSTNTPSGILTSSRFTWEPADRVYHLNGRYETRFDENGYQTYQAHYYHSWSLDRWWGCSSDGCGKKEWTYDNMGNQTMFTQSYWSKNQKEWIRFNQLLHEFDQHGNLTLVAQFSRDQVGDPWIGQYKYEYSYNKDNLEWGAIYYRWDINQNSWVPWFKSEKEFDSAGRITMEASFNWLAIDSSWVGAIGQMMSYWKRTFHYNDDGRLRLYTQYDWDMDLQEWTQVLRYFFYWSGSTAIHDFARLDLKVFPNPCDGVLNISGMTGAISLKIFTLQGQLLKSLITESEQVDLNDLSQGIYVLQIESHGLIFRQKLVIR